MANQTAPPKNPAAAAGAALSRALVPLRRGGTESATVRTRPRGKDGPFGLFDDTLTAAEARLDLRTFHARFTRLRRLVMMEVWAIIALVGLMIVGVPMLGTKNVYFATTPAGQVKRMVALTMPNMTHQAVLSWVTTTVTQVMTYNFANFNQEISKHQRKFLSKSWEQFVKVLLQDDMLKKFQQQELVLTTAPFGAPVITSEGVVDKRYQWVVQLPVIMNYVTNNNRSVQRRNIVELTVVRVPTTENPDGVAIKVWNAKKRKE
ncbi:MAG: hypothetical protein GC131_06920 [Alphaproteobacteria bacterium]|nr:hypothetical protein [Alphaproteobacteria bacterium]